MKQLLFLFLLVTTFSCKVQFVPSADAAMQAKVINGAKITDALYLQIIAATDKRFTTYAVKYAEVEAEINSIVLTNETRTKAQNLLGISNNLHDAFLKYETDHKTRNVLTNGELASYNAALKAHWKALIKSEMALK